MEIVLLVSLQRSGKSTFYRTYYPMFGVIRTVRTVRQDHNPRQKVEESAGRSTLADRPQPFGDSVRGTLTTSSRASGDSCMNSRANCVNMWLGTRKSGS
jgi:hypothetical protein